MACRWATKTVQCAPYVTSLPWISHYGCFYVVHGDDITSDSSGQDCYRFVKAAGRFLVVHRTPGISTTDIVGRMLLYSRDHNISSLARVLAGEEGPDPAEQRQEVAAQLKQRIEDFASDETGLLPHCDVWNWSQQPEPPEQPQHGGAEQKHQFTQIVAGQGPREGQRVVYVDGGFDLFSSGQIRFLQMVHEAEEQAGRDCSWDDDSHRKARLDRHGVDYRPAFVVAGVHDDETVQKWKGANYPIMNIIERGLCVLQCKASSILYTAHTPLEVHNSQEALPLLLPPSLPHDRAPPPAKS